MKRDIKYILNKYADVAQAIEKKAAELPDINPLSFNNLMSFATKFFAKSKSFFANIDQLIAQLPKMMELTSKGQAFKAQVQPILSKLIFERKRLNVPILNTEKKSEREIYDMFNKLVTTKKAALSISALLERLNDNSIKEAFETEADFGFGETLPIISLYRSRFNPKSLAAFTNAIKDQIPNFISNIDDLILKTKETLSAYKSETDQTKDEQKSEKENIEQETKKLMQTV